LDARHANFDTALLDTRHLRLWRACAKRLPGPRVYVQLIELHVRNRRCLYLDECCLFVWICVCLSMLKQQYLHGVVQPLMQRAL